MLSSKIVATMLSRAEVFAREAAPNVDLLNGACPTDPANYVIISDLSDVFSFDDLRPPTVCDPTSRLVDLTMLT